MELKEKILANFEGKVVRKDLTYRVKGNAVVPTYVLEYLLGQYCAIDDEAIIASGIEKVKDVISNSTAWSLANHRVAGSLSRSLDAAAA